MDAKYNYYNNSDIRIDITIRKIIKELKEINDLVYSVSKNTVITINDRVKDYTELFLYNRVWNNKECSLGGRLYNGITNLSSEERKGIYFNGVPAIELDYSAYVIRMLYHIEGIDIQGDVYSYRSNHDRTFLKKAINILINCAKDDSPVFVLSETTGDYDLALKIIKEVMMNHEAIRKYFYSGIGLKMQVLESEMSIITLKELLRRGIMTSNIHDCFLVGVNHIDIAYKVMIDSYQNVLKTKFHPTLLVKGGFYGNTGLQT